MAGGRSSRGEEQVKLTIHERLILNSILPPAGNFVTLGLVRKLREALSFSEEENKEFGIDLDDETQLISWKREFAETETEIEIGEKMTDLVKATLKRMNDADPPLLEDRHYSLYEKFIGE